MKIGVLKETQDLENRVAAVPETVKKYTDWGLTVLVEKGAGEASSISDEEFRQAGAAIADRAEILKDSGIVLKVQKPSSDEISVLRNGTILIGLFYARFDKTLVEKLNQKNITAFSLDGIPRIARAQKMDILSSQSNVAGYKAVLMAADRFKKMMPLMMTAAGTITPARVLVIGAGVAGLQAIATAKRLGAVVEAFDTRPVVKEQVESLGAKFLVMEAAGENKEDKGGYAKELSKDEHDRELAFLAGHVKNADIVITTALIPGKPAPALITEATVKSMKPGAIIVDLAAETGGNCVLTEKDKEAVKHGVTLIGHTNIPSLVACHASQLFARNVLNFVAEICPKGSLKINFEDEVMRGALATNAPAKEKV